MTYLTIPELEELSEESMLDTAASGKGGVRFLLAGLERLDRAEAIANLRRAATDAGAMAVAAEADAARPPTVATLRRDLRRRETRVRARLRCGC
jgi:hypothetical protein